MAHRTVKLHYAAMLKRGDNVIATLRTTDHEILMRGIASWNSWLEHGYTVSYQHLHAEAYIPDGDKLPEEPTPAET